MVKQQYNIITLPNILTYMRVLGVLLMVVFYYLPWDWSHYAAGTVFLLAAISDWVDGFLARNWDMKSKIGEFLDPVADKLLVCTALILMVQAYGNFIMVFIAVVIIGREITVMAMRSWLAEEVGSMIPHAAKVSLLGKVKTGLQLLGIAFFFAFPPPANDLVIDYPLIFLPWISLIVLTFATVITLWSAFLYARAILVNHIGL